MQDCPRKQSIVSNQRGQIVVEYVLLLIIAVGLAAFITTFVASRNPDQPGFLIAKWVQIINTIGADTADDLAPEEE